MAFIKYLGRAHLNSMNIAVTDNADGSVTARAENVVHNRSVGMRTFSNIEELDHWWDDLPGSGAGKLKNAIEIIRQDKQL